MYVNIESLPISESEPKSDEEIGPKMEEKSDTVAEKTTDEITDKKPSVTETVQKPVAKIREWDIGKESKLRQQMPMDFLSVCSFICLSIMISICVAKWFALPISDQGDSGSNPAGGKIVCNPKWPFFAQSLSYSHFHCPDMNEILLKRI